MAAKQTTLIAGDDVQRYLGLLFPDAPDDAWIVVSWLTTDKRFLSEWVMVGDTARAVATVVKRAKQCNTYVGLGLRHPGCTPHGRGTSDDIVAIGGVWIEYDHSGGIHTHSRLPTREQLATFLRKLPFKHSLLIESGGGIHAYLLFKELWMLDTPDERERASHLLRRFQRSMQLLASEDGWHIDTTADLARVLRPPGTLNHKNTPPTPVVILEETATRYNPRDIADAPWLLPLDDTYTPPRTHGPFPATLLAPIETECGWMAHCRDDAATLSEPEWYAMLGILGKCDEGQRYAHAWSASYPKYTTQETNAKLKHALAHGPRTCQKIRYDLGGEPYCALCPHWKQITSPLVLGMPPPIAVKADDPFALNIATPVGYPSLNGTTPQQAPTPQTTRMPQAAWRGKLFYKGKKHDELTQNVYNIMAILSNHEYWQRPDTLLWWDSVRGRPVCGEAEIDDGLMMDIATWFGDSERLPITSPRLLEQCVIACCKNAPRDLLQYWLNGLPPWDGVERLTHWLPTIAAIEPRAYAQDISRLLIVSMIARAISPGCQYRYVVILQGRQDLGKSELIRALATPAWYVELSIGLDAKEAHMMLQGSWVAELGELDSLSRTGKTRLKSFLTLREDSYIPKYSNFRQRTERRTIFIGTTNKDTYFNDETGNTRFLPLTLGDHLDLKAFHAMRTQLFAEGLHYYQQHAEDWWQLSSEGFATAQEEREQRRMVNVYEQPLHEWLEHGRATTVVDADETGAPIFLKYVEHETSWQEIAQSFLKLHDLERWKDRSLQMQIGEALTALGWHVKQVWKHGRNTNIWRKGAETPF